MTNSEQETMSAGHIHHPNHRTRVFALIAFLVLCLIISAFGGAVTATSVNDWYAALNKPSLAAGAPGLRWASPTPKAPLAFMQVS